MNKLISIAFIGFLVFFPVDRAFSASSDSLSKDKTFFELFIERISSIFSGSQSAEASDGEKDLGKERLRLLKALNTHELYVRSSMSGVEMYLAREQSIELLKKVKVAVEDSKLSDKNKIEVVSYIDDMRKVFLMDLVDSPQEKLKSVVLATFDEYEAMVFKLSEDEVASLNTELVKQGVNL